MDRKKMIIVLVVLVGILGFAIQKFYLKSSCKDAKKQEILKNYNSEEEKQEKKEQKENQNIQPVNTQDNKDDKDVSTKNQATKKNDCQKTSEKKKKNNNK